MYIKCPHCGAEYTLGEIYTKGELEGKSTAIVKSPTGRIMFIEWEKEPQLNEVFNCDYCGKDFNIKAELNFNSSILDEEVDFKQQYVSLLN